MTRRSPKRNVPASELMEFLDAHATIEVGLDRTERRFINNVWVDENHKRIIRRYRHGYVRSIRPESLEELLRFFNLEDSWQAKS